VSETITADGPVEAPDEPLRKGSVRADLATLLRARRWSVVNALRGLRNESLLKVGFITTFAVAFWVALFLAFREAFFFIYKAPGFEAVLSGIVFSLFFLSLLVMLVFSNAVLIYSSLYRSGEVEFLLTLPVSEEAVFLYKYLETLVYSSWAFIYLGVPVIVAFGCNRGVPGYFYPAALVLFVVFVAIPAGVGSLIALLLVNFVPRSRLKVFLVLASGAFLLGVLLGLKYFSGLSGDGTFGASEISRITGKLAFSQNPWLPSLWLSKGVLSLSRAQPWRAGFYLLVILSNSFFFTMVAAVTSQYLFWRSYSKSHSTGSRNLPGRGRALSRLVHGLFFFLPAQMRLFLAKDIKTALREPAQWSQVLIFFGVLWIYIANIRSLPYNLEMPEARSTISLLNLGATSLVLSTFTGRFVYPLMSLEGKKFWVLGLAPIKRKQILYGKFLFSFFGSLVVSEALILFSDFILDFPASLYLCHALLVVAICAGLSAISVGLGARYPNLKEDNPARIVAGFGGTLNLIVSMFYIAALVITVAIPQHLALARAGSSHYGYLKVLAAYYVWSLAFGGAVSVFFLNVGLNRFQELEF